MPEPTSKSTSPVITYKDRADPARRSLYQIAAAVSCAAMVAATFFSFKTTSIEDAVITTVGEYSFTSVKGSETIPDHLELTDAWQPTITVDKYSKCLRYRAEVYSSRNPRLTVGTKITKTALIPNLKVEVFNHAVFGIENFALKGGVLDPAKFSIKSLQYRYGFWGPCDYLEKLVLEKQ